jgi:hypothetical protein
MKWTIARALTLAGALAVAPALGACNRDADVEDDVDVTPTTEVTPDQAVRVTDVDLGRSIGTDKRVNDNDDTDEFRPSDTIYVSVDTEGTASGATLTARWTFEDGQAVDETSQTMSPTGPTVSEFHIAKPDGFPVGKYRVEILLNGQSVESKDFEVK